MIKTENLTKVYRTEEVETRALNNVSLHIKKGEFVSIMGLPVVENPHCSIFWACWTISLPEVTSLTE